MKIFVCIIVKKLRISLTSKRCSAAGVVYVPGMSVFA